MQLELRQLRSFLAVAEELNFMRRALADLAAGGDFRRRVAAAAARGSRLCSPTQ
jgi:hypothetical protein